MTQSDQKRILALYDKGIIDRQEVEHLLNQLDDDPAEKIIFLDKVKEEKAVDERLTYLERLRKRLAKKTIEKHLTLTFKALDTIFLTCLHGDVRVCQAKGDQILLENRVCLLDIMACDADQFLQEHIFVNYGSGTLHYHISHPKIKSKITLYLPSVSYNLLEIKQLDGQISLSQLDIEDIAIKTGTSKVKIDQVSASSLSVHQEAGDLDGKIKVADGYFYNQLGGEVRLVSQSKSDHRLVVEAEVANIRLHYPKQLGLSGNLSTEKGKLILNRTRLLDRGAQLNQAGQAQLSVRLRSKQGAIELKGI